MSKNFLYTDAKVPPYWVYLNLSLPYVRWNTALGRIYPASYDSKNKVLHFSMFASQRLKRGLEYFNFEMALEQERVSNFPQKISRLRGLFVFDTEEEAQNAEKLWGDSNNHFQSDCLTQASCEIGHNKSKHDSNWITCYLQNEPPAFPFNWKELYWAGIPYPHKNPIWETIVDSPLTLLNTKLRQSVSDRLHEELRCTFLLRLGILASELDNELGRSSITLFKDKDCLQIKHMINFDEKTAIQLVRTIKETKPEYMNYLNPKDEDTLCILPDSRSSDFCITHRCKPQECAS